jgi:hypothetical protein
MLDGVTMYRFVSDSGMSRQLLNLYLQFPRQPDIVGILKGDPLESRALDSFISRGLRPSHFR